jgi:hypothetical protein
MEARFDILREDFAGDFLWLEAVTSIEAAASRIEILSAQMAGRFVVFDQRLQATVPTPRQVAAASGFR